MKRKFNKIPIIILLITGIILSSTAVFALGSGIADFPALQEPQDNGSSESTTPPMLHDGQDNSNKEENKDEQNNPDTPSEMPTPTGEETSGNGDGNDSKTQEPTTNPDEPKTGEEDNNPGDENTSTPEPENTNTPEPTESEVPGDNNTGDNDVNTEEPTDDKVIEEPTDDKVIEEPTGDDAIVAPTDDAVGEPVEENKPSASPSDGNKSDKKELEDKTKEAETAVQTPDNAIAIQQNGTVNILAVNDQYKGLNGVTISMGAVSTITNASGSGSITAPAGSYIYTATAPGYRVSSGTITIVPNQTTSIVIVIVPLAVGTNEPGKYIASFIIRDQSNPQQAIPNVKVQTADISAVSNDYGLAMLTALLPGEYKVNISCTNYYAQSFNLTISDADVTETVTLTKVVEVTPTPNPEPAPQPNPPQPSAVAPQPPVPQPTSQPTTAYKPSKPYKPSTGNSGSSSKNSGNSSQTVTLNKIKDSNSNKQDDVDVEIIESGNLTVEPTATPSPQPTKTPMPTPTPMPSADGTTYTVSFNLTNLNGTSIAGKTVELHSDVMTGTTDAQGFVTFEKVPTGEHNLYILDANGEVESTKAFSINSGVETELDLANVGGDKIYVGMGTDAVTIDAVVDGSLMALTQVTSGTNPKAAPMAKLDQPTKEDNNLMWMLIISVSAAAIAIIILLMAIRKMKKAKSVDIHANGSAAINVDDKGVKKGKLKK